METASGGYYLHERGVDLPFDEDRALSRVLSQVLAPEAPGDAGALFLDIETVGLSNRPLFLVGVLTLQSDGLWLRQLLARDYSEERAVLEATQDLLRHHPHLVTFNGKTFDVPYIANRCLHHQLPPPEPRSHLDLLFAARRFWRRFIPNCRLQTIERHLCCRERVDDIPGAQMGQVYRDFIRTGDATRIRGALHHNLLDLIAMAEMVCLLGEAGTLPARSRQEILPYRGT
ncbi:MAG TPA: ribonuclease H-like domain-containing protein [Armatimonadetes bacterium]|nr:ribonuclease H-like domain-containing protein [Armatimonadota bacterium]